jgi:hypothetical protein
MKLGTVLPWLCVLGSLAVAGWFYSVSQRQEAQMAPLRADNEQLQQLRTELEEAKKARTQGESDEVVRLRKDREELLRLRNEVRQLRGDKQQLAGQVQAAENQVASAQAQAEAIKAAAQAPTPEQQAAAQALAARAGMPPTADPEQVKARACVMNLRTIDGAKQQWAIEKQKPNGAILTATDLLPYLPNNTMPTCPGGGVYTLNPVGLAPICNIPGHAPRR